MNDKAHKLCVQIRVGDFKDLGPSKGNEVAAAVEHMIHFLSRTLVIFC